MSAGEASIGVVMPARDAAPYIGAAIESVLGQVGASPSLIVVDDGSQDETASIAAAFGPRVTVVSLPPRGPAAARNEGIRRLETAYVAMLDADDLWPAGSLRARLAALEAEPTAELCFGRVEQFISPDLADDEQARLHVPPPRAAWASSAMLARRAVFERAGLLPEHRRAGDFLEWLLAARAAGAGIVTIDDIVLRRRLHRSNLTRREPEANADYVAIVRAELSRKRAAGG